MESFVRILNYYEDYFRYVHELYAQNYIGYPVTYYSIDWKNSVYDEKELGAGTYEKLGVGTLSGLKWKKILLLPIHGVEQITPNNNTSEKGILLEDSEITQISFPSEFGIIPNPWDIIHFKQEFMDQSNDISPLFTVTQINLGHYGNYLQLYQCRLKVAPFSRDIVENQISEYMMFLDITKKIHNVKNAQILLHLQGVSKTLSDRVSSKIFNNKLGLYFQEKELR